MVLAQPSLFDTAEAPYLRPLADAVERTVLGSGAWVDVRRAWIGAPALLFERLVEEVPWHGERRQMYDRFVDVPRLQCFYEVGQEGPDPLIAAARQELSRWYEGVPGAPLETIGFNLYRDGNDSVAWHGDRIGRGSREDTLVAIVSLGSPRRFLLRPRGGGSSLSFELGPGDLFVMGGSCQRTWEHCVPKTRRPVGSRLSVQLRPAEVR